MHKTPFIRIYSEVEVMGHFQTNNPQTRLRPIHQIPHICQAVNGKSPFIRNNSLMEHDFDIRDTSLPFNGMPLQIVPP